MWMNAKVWRRKKINIKKCSKTSTTLQIPYIPPILGKWCGEVMKEWIRSVYAKIIRVQIVDYEDVSNSIW